MAAPKVGKGIVGKVGNVGAGKSGISQFSQKGEKSCSFPCLPAQPREIRVHSSASYPFMSLPQPDRECVSLLQDHATIRG